MIAWKLLTPRNIVVIGLIAVMWHVALAPVLGSIAKPASPDQNT